MSPSPRAAASAPPTATWAHLHRSQSTEKRDVTDVRQRRMRAVGWACALVLTALLLLRCARAMVSVFHWAEKHIDRESHAHMLLFLAATLPFNLGLPIPIVHQAWAVTVGVFFRWRAFPLLVAMLAIGVPLPFLLGRRLAGVDRFGAWLRRTAPGAMAYMAPLRRTVAARPVRSSFLLMWAPLPTSTLPLLAGFLIPSSELPLRAFVSGAFPSKLLHFAPPRRPIARRRCSGGIGRPPMQPFLARRAALPPVPGTRRPPCRAALPCRTPARHALARRVADSLASAAQAADVLVGIEAGSLAAALDDHDELPDLDEVSDHLSLASGRRRARRIAVATMGMTLLFVLAMVHTMHRSLREMKEHREEEEEAPMLPV